MRMALLCSWLLGLALVLPSRADDWPQWLGPQRDSVWRESGLVEKFPEEGLKVKWRVPVELGYSGPAVAGGKVFVMDYAKESGEVTNNPGGRAKLTGKERVLCFSAADGKLLWKYEYDQPYHLSYPGGPRCTPTVAGGKVYALGAEGMFHCLDASDGTVLWKKNFTQDYDARAPIWGFTAHPLVAGDLVYCIVGGKGSVAVAFHKDTGKEVWRALSAKEQGYCPPTMIEHAGRKQLLIWHPEALNALNPASGEVHWSVPLEPSYGMSITVPRKHGDYLYASGIGHTSLLLKLTESKPEEVWRGDSKTSVYSANGTPILTDEMIYGCDCQLGAFIGARLKDGERLWQTYQPTAGGNRRVSHGTAFLVKHEDRYFLFSETGDLILAQLLPEGYREISRFHVLEPTNEAFRRDVVWSHPAFAQKCCFARNDKELVCVSLAREDN